MHMEMRMEQERPQIEICDACQSGQHGCQRYFCMCDCRYPLPWRAGAAVTHNTIHDANGETVAYDVISATRPSVIRERILRAVNHHDALVKALTAALHAMRSYQYGNASPDLADEVELASQTVLLAAQE